MRSSKAMLLTSVYACMATFLVVAFYTSLRLFENPDILFVVLLGILLTSSVLFYVLMKVVGNEIAETVCVTHIYPQRQLRRESTLDEWDKLQSAIADISDSDS